MRSVLLFGLAIAAYGQAVRINAGGPAYTDALGQAWQADAFFTGGSISTGPIPAGAQPHYVTKRYGDFVYVIPVPDGNYSVALSFLENVVGPGGRAFAISINGTTVTARYDVAAIDGANVPVRKIFPALAAGAGIRISFTTIVRSAFVNAIEILPATAPAKTPTYLSGLASAMPASCPVDGMTFYAAADTGELWWCLAPGSWSKVGSTSAGVAVLWNTPTQAILTYEAPDGATPCIVEASESATYRPLVHDVDPVLFPGSDSDVGGDQSLTGRMLVLGKRATETAADGNNYSRALQALTRHYVRITCGPNAVRTIAFTTANIPAGATFNEGPQVDRDHPGQWKMPTRLEDRGQTIVDPQTGALLKAVSLQAEANQANGGNGIFLQYGGFIRLCDPKLVGPAGGPLGFICTFPRYGQMNYHAYWIVPGTGEVRLLGAVPQTQGGAWGAIDGDLRSYGPDNSGNLVRATYTGNFQQSGQAAVSAWETYSTVPMSQLMHDFDAGYDVAVGCGQARAAAGSYTLVQCLSGGQDSPGWLGVLFGGDGRPIAPGCIAGDACPRIVAAADIFHIPASLNCTLHNVQPMGDVISINVQQLSGQPCAAMGHMVYWRFKTDPHGAALVVDNFFDGGGHWDYGPLGRITETGGGWSAVLGATADHLNEPYSVSVLDSPFFAGVHGIAYGNTIAKHPSYHQVAGVAPAGELSWFTDMVPFDGGQFYSTPAGADLISGTLYKYNLPPENAVLNRKQLATLAVSGGRALVDVSGPGSALGDTAADNLRYCVVLLPGECRTGSAAGDIYVNAPGVTFRYCKGSDGPNPQDLDLCVGNLGTYAQSLVQADLASGKRRVLTHGLSGIRNSFFYATAKVLPDASWVLFNWGMVPPGGDLTNVWMAKIPPLVDDGVDRSTFARLPVTLTAPTNLGIVMAAIEFGYLENGDPGLHYCTSRREACVAAATVTDANPFVWASEGFTGTACTSSCTITVPVIPGRVVYYRGVFLDGTGQRVGVGPDQISATK